MKDPVTFNVTCTMSRRWVAPFLGMLKSMQHLGDLGSSRHLDFFADGDGDFRPSFTIHDTDIVPAKPRWADSVGKFDADFQESKVGQTVTAEQAQRLRAPLTPEQTREQLLNVAPRSLHSPMAAALCGGTKSRRVLITWPKVLSFLGACALLAGVVYFLSAVTR